MRRNSPKMLALRSYDAAKFLLPFLVLWGSLRARLDGWAGWASAAVLVAYGVSRLHYVLSDWWTTRYSISENGFRLARGFVVREDLTVAWTDVASVQVSRPWLHQALRCSAVRVGIGSQGRQELVLEAVPDSVALSLEDRFRRSHDGPRKDASSRRSHGAAAPAAPRSPDTQVVYAIRTVDYLLISITYGQFALVLPAVVGAYAQASDWLDLPAPDTLRPAGAWSGWAIAALVLGTVAVAVGYGCATAWLRYRSFRVLLQDGDLSTTGGLASQERRQLLRAQVGGLKVQQNPLMRLAGYGKLSVVSRQSGTKVGANVVFPAVSLRIMAEKIDLFFPEYAAVLGPGCHDRRRVTGVLFAVAGSVVLVCAWAASHALRPDRTYLVVAVVAAVELVASNRLWAGGRLDETTGSVVFWRGFLWVRRYQVPVACVHTAALTVGPLRRRLGVGSLSLLVYDTRRVRLRLPWCPAASLQAIVGAVEVCGAAAAADGTPGSDRNCAGTAEPPPPKAQDLAPQASGVASLR